MRRVLLAKGGVFSSAAVTSRHTSVRSNHTKAEETAELKQKDDDVRPRHQRALRSEDHLARSIMRLGNTRERRGKFSLPASELRLHQSKPSSSTGPARQAPRRTEKRAPPPLATEHSAVVEETPKWTPPFRIPVPAGGAQVQLPLVNELPHVTEVAFTLEELEQNLFTAQGSSERIAEEAPAAAGSSTGPSTEELYATGIEEKREEVTKQVIATTAEAAKETSAKDSVETREAVPRRWLNSRLPCSFMEGEAVGSTHAAASPSTPWQSCWHVSRTATGGFSVKPVAIFPTVADVLRTLNEALTFVERTISRQHADRDSSLVDVSLFLTGNTTATGEGTRTTLCAAECEAVLPPVERLELAYAKQRLLKRLKEKGSMRVTAIVGAQHREISDLAAEILLCCDACKFLGAESVVVGLPSLACGVFPSPETVRAVSMRAPAAIADPSPKVVADTLWQMHTQPCPQWALTTSNNAPKSASAFLTEWTTKMLQAAGYSMEKKPSYLPSFADEGVKSIQSLFLEYCAVVLQNGPWQEILISAMLSTPFVNSSQLYRQFAVSMPQRIVYPVTQTRFIPIRSIDKAEKLSVEGEDEAVAVVVSSSIPQAERVKRVASVRISQGHDEASCSFVLVGPISSWQECTSMLSCAAVISPSAVVQAADDASFLSRSLAELKEVSVVGHLEQVSDARLFNAQAAALQYLQQTSTPYVITATGEESAQLLTVMAHAMCRLLLSQDQSQGLLALDDELSQLLSFEVKPTALLRHCGAPALSAISRKRKLAAAPGEVKCLQAEFLTHLDNTVNSGRSAADDGDCRVSGEFRTASPAAKYVVAALVDQCCLSLCTEAVGSAADMAVLSMAALALHPGTGGLLTWADQHGCGAANLVEFMESRSPDLYHWRSLPMLRWMAAQQLKFAGLTAEVLGRMRRDLEAEPKDAC